MLKLTSNVAQQAFRSKSHSAVPSGPILAEIGCLHLGPVGRVSGRDKAKVVGQPRAHLGPILDDAGRFRANGALPHNMSPQAVRFGRYVIDLGLRVGRSLSGIG